MEADRLGLTAHPDRHALQFTRSAGVEQCGRNRPNATSQPDWSKRSFKSTKLRSHFRVSNGHFPPSKRSSSGFLSIRHAMDKRSQPSEWWVVLA